MAYVFRRPWRRVVQPKKRAVIHTDPGTAANTIAAFTSAAAGKSGTVASGADTIAPFVSVGTDILGVVCAAANTITAFTSTGRDVNGTTGSAANTLGLFTQVATAVDYQQGFVPGTVVGATNPCLQAIIPSYLYKQYSDDDNLQAFVSAYNTLAQEYLSWLNTITLPVYTNPIITGALLDWIALGLYGQERPSLSAGNDLAEGPYNSGVYNVLPYNARKVLRVAIFTPVDDDIFKRILTWKLYKGDGKVMDINWLKRRVYRFLYGTNGTDLSCADTSQISVTFNNDSVVTLTVISSEQVRTAQSPLFNTFAFNTVGFDRSNTLTRTTQTLTTYTHGNRVVISIPSTLPNAAMFQEAVAQGVLDMPFQFDVVVNTV